jgi:hypothetical protein
MKDDVPLQTESSMQPDAAPRRPSRIRRVVRWIIGLTLTTMIVLAGIWALGAIALADLDGGSPRVWTPLLFALAFAGVLIFVRTRTRSRVIAAAMIVAILLWYVRIAPSNDRQWVPQYVRLATADIEGERVVLRNYRTLLPDADGNLREQYVEQTFDVRELERVDVIMSYWGPERIAHALVSFQFSDGRCAAASIEARRRTSQSGYDPLTSLFRNFELIYVVGDERALIGGGLLDDYHRIFLYRTNMNPQRARALFLRYARTLNALAEEPQWYNAITDNCTTSVYWHLRQIPPTAPFSMALLINGELPEYMYRRGIVDRSIPWAELKQKSDIKQIGRQAYPSADFSRLIREKLPAPPLATQK